MIRIFIYCETDNKRVWEMSASQYTINYVDNKIIYRKNSTALTLILKCKQITTIEKENGNFHILAYMTEEEIRNFESNL